MRLTIELETCTLIVCPDAPSPYAVFISRLTGESHRLTIPQLIGSIESAFHLKQDKEEKSLTVKTGEADLLRSNMADYLAPLYLRNPSDIAELCDEQLDRTGRLLGMVRQKASHIQSKPS